MEYGKKTEACSYFKGVVTKREVTYSIPTVVMDKSQTLSEMMKSLDLITAGTTEELTLTIKADKGKFKMITKCYKVAE